MRFPLLLLCLPLAACTPQPANQADDGGNAVDFTPMEPLNPPAPGTPGGLPNEASPIEDEPGGEDSAQAATQVVRAYYAHVAQGDFRKAWLLWANHGAASDMTAQDFAASFADYSEYHARVGAPGEIDAGAGQRHVTVPVQVYGRLREGNKPFYMLGTVTLGRTDVDGASAEQRQWRIGAVDFKPQRGSGPVAAADKPKNARFRCIDGSKITAVFGNGDVTILRAGKRLATLQQQRAASGIWYAGGGYEFRGKGDDMDFTEPGLPPLPCTAIRPGR